MTPTKESVNIARQLFYRVNKRATPDFWRENPSYTGVVVSENFQNMDFFLNWCHNQVGFMQKDHNGLRYAMDKDILPSVGKLYSEGHCVFVPTEINNLVLSKNSGISVTKSGSYEVRYGRDYNGSRIWLGTYKSLEEAQLVYDDHKFGHIRTMIVKYQDKVDSRVLLSLKELLRPCRSR